MDRFVRAARVVKTHEDHADRADRTADRFFLVDDCQRSRICWSASGIQVLPIDAGQSDPPNPRAHCADRGQYQEELAQFRQWISFDIYRDEDDILPTSRCATFGDRPAGETWTVSAFRRSTRFQPSFGRSLCFGVPGGRRGLPGGARSDLHGAISSVLLEAAAVGEPSFLPDITIRHPENDNAVLLWHGDAPLSLRDPDSPVKIDLPWILKGLPPGCLTSSSRTAP